MRKSRKDEQSVSDLELARGCSEGNPLAQELLYRRHFSFAMALCVRYTRDHSEAMEVVNDSFMKVLENIRSFDGSKPFTAWYGRILVNTAIDHYRRNSRHSSFLQITDTVVTAGQEPAIDAELSASEILSLFSQLPDQYRVTFNLYEIEGYSHEEIGEMLEITSSTSRSNLTRAKKMLRELYIKNFNPDRKRDAAV